MTKQFLTEIRRMVEELTKQGGPIQLSAFVKIAAQISKAFDVKLEEVAILALTDQDRFLRFLVPEKLQEIGKIPMTSTTALAVRTIRDKRPETINNFPAARHHSVFEAVPLGDERGEPIQKMMSAPILVENKVVGAIQVSRKAKSFATAGPDFTAAELKELIAVSNLLGPCLKLCPDA